MSEPDPLLRVIKGSPTDEEIAALVAVVTSLGRTASRPEVKPSEWAAPHRALRVAYSHGPEGWRSAGLPR